MSVTNSELSLHKIERKEKQDGFTLLQAVTLVLLTFVVSVVGWYAAGKYFFWSDLDMQRVQQQLEYLQKKVQAEPKNLENRVALGYTYYLKGENEKAVKELNQVLEIDKNYYNAHYNLGLVYLDEGKLDDALDEFQKCVEISPRDHKGYLNKGITYRKMGMYKEALESLEKANKLAPGSANIIYEIGMVAEAKGDKKTAAGIYKEALSYDPLYKEAAKALKRVQK